MFAASHQCRPPLRSLLRPDAAYASATTVQHAYRDQPYTGAGSGSGSPPRAPPSRDQASAHGLHASTASTWSGTGPAGENAEYWGRGPPQTTSPSDERGG